MLNQLGCWVTLILPTRWLLTDLSATKNLITEISEHKQLTADSRLPTQSLWASLFPVTHGVSESECVGVV